MLNGPTDEKRLGRSELAPARLVRVPKVELDGCDSEETNDGGFICVLLDPVIVRGPGDAPDESSRGNRNRVVRIEVGSAVYPPGAGENQREAIGRVGVRGARVAWVPLHQPEIRSGLVQAAVKCCHLAAVRRQPATLSSHLIAPGRVI